MRYSKVLAFAILLAALTSIPSSATAIRLREACAASEFCVPRPTPGPSVVTPRQGPR